MPSFFSSLEVRMDKIKKLGSVLYKIYFGIGIFSIALMTCCVIFAVIARYCFGYSHKALEEFITTVFAFSTFWGIGICFIENEHVTIDSIYAMFPKWLKIGATFFNNIVTMIVLVVMVKFGGTYALKFGSQISSGMEIPYIWMYGIIPIGCALGVICLLIKFCQFIVSLAHPLPAEDSESSEENLEA